MSDTDSIASWDQSTIVGGYETDSIDSFEFDSGIFDDADAVNTSSVVIDLTGDVDEVVVEDGVLSLITASELIDLVRSPPGAPRKRKRPIEFKDLEGRRIFVVDDSDDE